MNPQPNQKPPELSTEKSGEEAKSPFYQSTASFSIFLLIILFIIFRPAIFNGLTLSSISSIINPFGFYSELYTTASQFNENGLISSDNERVWVPTGMMLHRDLAKGELSLWNPYASNGMPFLAEEQTQANDPIYLLLHALFAPEHAAVLFVLLSFFLAGLFMYMLAKALSISWHGATLGGIAYMFSGPLVAWYLRPNSQIYVFIPLLFYAYEKGQKSNTIWWKVLAGIVLAQMFVAGHTQIAVLALIAYEIFLFSRSFFQTDKPWRARSAAWFTWNLIPGLTAFCLAAYKLLPFIELSLLTPVMKYGRAGILPLTWHKFVDRCLIGNLLHSPLEAGANMAKLVFPFLFGSPATFQKLPFDNLYYQPFGGNFAETACYFGIIALILCCPILLRYRKENKQLRSYILLFGFAFIVCFDFPVIGAIRALPLLSLINLNRLYFILCMAGSLLAGRGLDHLLSLSYRKRNIYLAIMTGLAGVSIITIHLLSPAYSPISHKYLYALIPTMLAGLLLISSLLNCPRSKLRTIFPFILIVLTMIDSLYFAWNYLIFQPPEIVHPKTGRSRLLSSYANPQYRMKYWGGFEPSYHLAYDGLMFDATFSVLQIKRQNELLQAVGKYTKTPPPPHRGTINTLSPKWLNFNAVGLVGIDQNYGQQMAEADSSPNLIPIYLDNDISLWQNKTAHSRFRLYSNYLSTDSAQQAAVHILSKDGSNKTALVSPETPPHLDYEKQKPPDMSPATSLSVREVSNDTLIVDVKTEKAAIFGTTDSWYPGWKAEVDQKPSPLLRLFHAFRGVEVPPGSHTITMYYSPLSFRVGIWITVCSLLLGSSSFALRFFRSKR